MKTEDQDIDFGLIAIAFCVCFALACLTIASIMNDKEKTKQTQIMYDSRAVDKVNKELAYQCGAEWNEKTNSWRCTR